jgi:hypothetical protein
MPPKKCKKCKKPKQVGGWFWERNDPIFGASNRYIGDKIIKPVDNFLKDTKVLSRIITPIGGFLGGPAGAVAGAVAGVGLNKAGYGYRPRAKHPQYGCGILRPSGLPMKAKPIYRPQSGGSSPFMLANNSSFNSIKLR